MRRRDGVKIVYFIHDLIPLLTPEHVVDDVPRQFASWLGRLSGSVDGFLTNSQATKVDLDGWLEDRGLHVETRVVRLAHQFATFERSPFQKILSSSPTTHRQFSITSFASRWFAV